jgi:hypothetical protein
MRGAKSGLAGQIRGVLVAGNESLTGQQKWVFRE